VVPSSARDYKYQTQGKRSRTSTEESSMTMNADHGIFPCVIFNRKLRSQKAVSINRYDNAQEMALNWPPEQ
jgi:hypothetical protein